MSLWQALLLASGVVAAIAGHDLLRHRDLPQWPLPTVVLLLIPLSGYLYSANLLSFTLGASIGTCSVTLTLWGRDFARNRRRLEEIKKQQDERRRKQLDIDSF
ncbi:hypothetical protein ACUH9X_04145 [Dermabacteraceae bacterium P13147]